MKIVAIGDIHGRSIWKNIIEKESFDKLVFMGDYFDSKEDIPSNEPITNFKEIIQLKRVYPEKVILLLGNHDYHYLKDVYQTYPCFQAFEQPVIQELLKKLLDEDLIQLFFKYDKFVFTHAGLSSKWFIQTFGTTIGESDDL